MGESGRGRAVENKRKENIEKKNVNTKHWKVKLKFEYTRNITIKKTSRRNETTIPRNGSCFEEIVRAERMRNSKERSVERSQLLENRVSSRTNFSPGIVLHVTLFSLDFLYLFSRLDI